MAVIDFAYQPGTIKQPQHTQSTKARFIETTLVHFPDGRATPIPAFAVSNTPAGSVAPVGITRAQWGSRLGGSNANLTGAYYLFGTHIGLYAEHRSVRYNMTPLVETATTTLGADPIETLISSQTVVITYTAHGLSIGDRIKLTGATATGGVPAGDINIEHIVTSTPDANTFTIDVATAATSTANGGGSGVDIFKQIAAGNPYQTSFSGYGAGIYGSGIYGAPRTSTTSQVYPRISSFSNFGNSFLYCPGDYDAGDGQKIYIWDGDKTTAPAPLDGTLFPNAPTNCNWVAVIANQIVALCGTNIIIGLTDPSTGGATFPTVPATSTAGDVIPVQRATRLLSIAPLGEKSGVVFAPEPYILRFVGGVWELAELGVDFPIVAPNAWCNFGETVVWYAEDGNYYQTDGGSVRRIVNRESGEYVRNRLNKNAIWTTFLMADQKHNQFWHYYPAESSQNPNEYVIFNPGGGGFFTTGTQTRTAGQRPSVVDQKFYMTDESTIYSSFTNQTVSFNWSAKTAFFHLDGTHRYRLNFLYPDVYQQGDVHVTIFGKEYAQGAEINYGTYLFEEVEDRVTVEGAGKLLAFEFSGTSDAMVGGMKMEAQQQGTRTG